MNKINSILILIVALMGCQESTSVGTYLTEQHQRGKLNGNVLIIQNGKIVYEKLLWIR